MHPIPTLFFVGMWTEKKSCAYHKTPKSIIIRVVLVSQRYIVVIR